MKFRSVSLLLGVLTLVACAPVSNTTTKNDASMSAPMAEKHIVLTSSALQWVDAPAALPAGAKIVVLEGDPSKPGPFTMRIQFPANYRVAPHFHPTDEHVTVLSGTFAVGRGDTFDESALQELGVGGFMMMPTGTKHFARSKDGGIVQLHGIGPWGLTYVNPADDPRNAPTE